uniref:Uncharacterized protein n=1 Tax=Rhizophora mucronata TaxID=61149 RepID=A0A2P2KKM5_RHIMU
MSGSEPSSAMLSSAVGPPLKLLASPSLSRSLASSS